MKEIRKISRLSALDATDDQPKQIKIISTGELLTVDWADLIGSENFLDCNDLSRQIEKSWKKESAEQMVVGAVSLVVEILQIRDQFAKGGDPYGPMWTNFPRRSLIPADLKGDQTEALAAFVPSITDPCMKARIADICWLNNRRRRDIADIAIGAYVDLAEMFLNGAGKFLAQRQSEIDRRATLLLRRAFQISKMIKGKAVFPDALLSLHRQYYDQSFVGNDCYTAARAASFALDFAVVPDDDVLASILEFLERVTPADPDDRLTLFEIELQIHHRNSRLAEAAVVHAKIAECHVEKSNAISSSLARANFLMKAISVYRLVPGSDAKQRIDELRRLLRDVQADTQREMQTFRGAPIDIGPLVADTISRFEDLSMGMSLGVFASVHQSEHVEELRHQAVKTIQDHPLSSLFASSYLDSEGKVVERSEVEFGTAPNESQIQRKMSEHLSIMRGLVVKSAIKPARQTIIETHRFPEAAFGIIAQNSPFVPESQIGVFVEGFLRFMYGDMVSAGSILIPQVENSLRHILTLHGTDSSVIHGDETQEDRNIAKLLERHRAELVEILGLDIVVEIDLLFNQRPGPALRHGVAHGKLSEGHLYGQDVVYACWFIFRLTALPLFGEWEKVAAAIDEH